MTAISPIGPKVESQALNDNFAALNEGKLDKGGLFFLVTDYGAIGNGVAVDTTAIDDAIDAVVTAGGGTIIFPFTADTHTYLTTTLTFPAGVAAWFFTGAKLLTNTPNVVTFDGPFKAEEVQTFSGTGTFVLNKVNKFIPQWWGANGDGTADDYSSITAAITACPAGGEVFLPLPSTFYRSSQKIVIDKPIKFRGVYSVFETAGGAEQTCVIKFDSTVKTGIEVTSYSTYIEGVTVQLQSAAVDTIACIYYNSAGGSPEGRNNIIRNVNTSNYGLYGAGVKSNGSVTMTLDNIKTSQGKYGFYFNCPSSLGTSVTFIRCWATNYAFSGACGYYIEDHYYVSFLNTTADSVNSPDHGYYFKNCHTVSMNGAATELSEGSNYYFDACTSISMSACYGVFGNVSGTGSANASFAELVNGTKYVTMESCADHNSTAYVTPNVWCDATSKLPVNINSDFPKGVSDNGIVLAPYFPTITPQAYVMIGRSMITDGPVGSGFTTLSGRPWGTNAVRLGVLRTDMAAWLGYIDFDGSVMIGEGGDPIKKHISVTTASQNFGSVPATSTAEVTVTVTGAAVGDSVTVTPNATLANGFVWSGYVSAANTVKIRVANVTAGALDPDSTGATWRIDVWKH